MMVGSMVGMAVTPHKKKFSMGKALKSMGDVVENVTNAIGL
jgi:hypothetical protein